METLIDKHINCISYAKNGNDKLILSFHPEFQLNINVLYIEDTLGYMSY